MSILDATGQRATRCTETQLDPRLVRLMPELEDVVNQNGIRFMCVKCKTEVQGDSTPGRYVLKCLCATRVLDTLTGHEKVHVHA